ncbi:SDR family NAD(P)-dependent oxidoreductase [Actinokineospora inagensis]|uniref:SDR family NAD(P)-dependent oxidoreductase n=1 Tax=Actinokineospora inagensis TaxID=103730 RepID=UPI000404E997|nr:SDR family oxidoreductase [Actinokineospora inagensis]
MRTVLVTGGSSGIGAALVARFAAAGDRVWFTYRSGRERAGRIAAELTAAGHEVAAFEFEQGDWVSHQRLAAELPGPVDVLVNNAAVGSETVRRQVDGGEAELAAVFLKVNSVGPLWLVDQVLPDMLRRGHGVIVNIASVGGGVATFPGFHIADGMSKAALAYLTRHLAAELTHQPVRVAAVCPGAVDTEMLRASTLDKLTDQGRAELCARLPGGRLIEPAEVAELVHWLTTPAAALMHGAVLDASMGLGVHPGLLSAREPVGSAS